MARAYRKVPDLPMVIIAAPNESVPFGGSFDRKTVALLILMPKLAHCPAGIFCREYT
jgi:hypothetical protein